MLDESAHLIFISAKIAGDALSEELLNGTPTEFQSKRLASALWEIRRIERLVGSGGQDWPMPNGFGCRPDAKFSSAVAAFMSSEIVADAKAKLAPDDLAAAFDNWRSGRGMYFDDTSKLVKLILECYPTAERKDGEIRGIRLRW